MSGLKGNDREKLPKGKFALPDERRCPIEDEAHARNAKARAGQQGKDGQPVVGRP